MGICCVKPTKNEAVDEVELAVVEGKPSVDDAVMNYFAIANPTPLWEKLEREVGPIPVEDIDWVLM